MRKRYNSYKDSGVEWIGEIPSHWIKGKWGYYYNSGMGSTILKEDLVENGEVPVYSATEEDRIFGYINNPKLILNEGDIVIPARGNSIGHVKLISSKSTTSQTTIYSKSKDENLDSRYSYYYCKGNKTNLFPFIQTAIPQITVTEISFNPIIIPPLSEQQQIVSYLDTKTSLIDSLIEKTQRKIELLKEKRTSLINEVVTKGLNPNVEMKDSGVEWIGEIPSHWKTGKLYQYSEMSNGSTPSRVKPEYWENGTIPWMSSGEINKKKIREIDGRITKEGFENSSTKLLPIGTVMMGLNGQGKTKGTVGILEIETTCNQSLCGMIFKDVIYPMFSYYYLDSQYYHIRGLVGEGQREGISVSFLGRYPFVVPPLSEQQQIVSHLDEQTQLIDNTISIEEKRIELLKEYRQSLISEVVTGKLKVTTDE